VLFKDLRTFAFKLVLYVSVSDAIYSFANLFGDVAGTNADDEGKFPCQLQAIVISYFELSSILWSCAIAFTLHMAIIRDERNSTISSKQMWYHLLCWGLPVFFTILPAFTKSYGDSGGWCWIKDDTDIAVAWRFITFYIPLWLAMCYCAWVYWGVRQKVSHNLSTQRGSMKDRIKYYPLVLVICWFWASVNRIEQIFGPSQFWLFCLHVFFSSLQGAFNAFVYGLTKDIRTRVAKILPFSVPCCPIEIVPVPDNNNTAPKDELSDENVAPVDNEIDSPEIGKKRSSFSQTEPQTDTSMSRDDLESGGKRDSASFVSGSGRVHL